MLHRPLRYFFPPTSSKQRPCSDLLRHFPSARNVHTAPAGETTVIERSEGGTARALAMPMLDWMGMVVFTFAVGSS